MAIPGFDYNHIAQNFAEQSRALLNQTADNLDPNFPASDNLKAFTEEDKDYVVNKVSSFCIVAGGELQKNPNIQITAEEASILTQIIGEWTFHKSIDLITAKIEVEHRDLVLQNIAMHIYQSGLEAIVNKVPLNKLLPLIEEKVATVYKNEVQKLQKKGVLDEKQFEKAITASNFDEMVTKTEDEVIPEAPVNKNISNKKILKLATLAIIMRKLPKEQSAEILTSFDKQDVAQIINYMKMPNIEDKIDPQIIVSTLEELKTIIPLTEELNAEKIVKRFNKLIKNVPESVLKKIAKRERESVRSFILDRKFPATEIFPPRILQSLVDSIEDKLNDYKKEIH